jgi:ATP-dependent Clp protease ATP-binding subunit ClpC
MFDDVHISGQARAALQLAEEEARRLQHEYIGTEHVLLGLIAEGAGVAATVLRARGLDYARIHQEVEQLVRLGPDPVTAKELPFTPRALQAIRFAEEDARMLGQSQVDTEHLLTGLLREPDGVAGVVLRKCGLNIQETGAEIFKIRLLQMKIVERAVRPVRANIARKRRMRDEMLAHLSAIYDEELAGHNDPLVAVKATAKRFGDPAELTAELQATVPRRESWEFEIESRFGWHAPETAVRWMTRVAIQVCGVMACTCALVAVVAFREFGWSYSIWLTIRPVVAAAIVLPTSVATFGICYYKVRDHLFGVFGSRKSWRAVFAWAALLAAVTVGCGFTFLAISYSSLDPASAAFYPCMVTGIIWAAAAVVFARISGPQEIRDAGWALLDLTDQPLAA